MAMQAKAQTHIVRSQAQTKKWEAEMAGGNWKEMYIAGCEGDLELVKYHVKQGVDVNYAHPEFLSTPLVASALAGQEEVALYLLDSGANPHLPSEFDALTPIQAARKAKLAGLEAKLTQLGASAAVLPGANRDQRGWFSRLFARHSA